MTTLHNFKTYQLSLKNQENDIFNQEIFNLKQYLQDKNYGNLNNDPLQKIKLKSPGYTFIKNITEICVKNDQLFLLIKISEIVGMYYIEDDLCQIAASNSSYNCLDWLISKVHNIDLLFAFQDATKNNDIKMLKYLYLKINNCTKTSMTLFCQSHIISINNENIKCLKFLLCKFRVSKNKINFLFSNAITKNKINSFKYLLSVKYILKYFQNNKYILKNLFNIIFKSMNDDKSKIIFFQELLNIPHIMFIILPNSKDFKELQELIINILDHDNLTIFKHLLLSKYIQKCLKKNHLLVDKILEIILNNKKIFNKLYFLKEFLNIPNILLICKTHHDKVDIFCKNVIIMDDITIFKYLIYIGVIISSDNINIIQKYKPKKILDYIFNGKHSPTLVYIFHYLKHIVF